MAKHLTKTDFISTFSCPTRLNYIRHPYKYTDSSEEDEFLQSLSDGGYQVGKLAQLNYQDGIEVSENREEAITETEDKMAEDSATIFEAAIEYKNFYVRIDITRKILNTINIIEVKAKSYDSSIQEEDNFYNQNGDIKAEWKDYFYDLAFQYYVVKKKYPSYKINCFFNLPNKNINSKVDGLFSKFSIKNKRAFFLGTKEDLIDNLIYEVNVTSKIEEIINSIFEYQGQEFLFYEIANELANAKLKNIEYKTQIGPQCKGCTFNDEDKEKSGMYQCWSKIDGFTDAKYHDEKIIDVWNLRSTKKLIEQEKFFIESIDLEDLKIDRPPYLSDKAFSNKDRQYFQCFGIETFQNDEGYIFNTNYLSKEIRKWKYPLNFIDFETATPAIPPYKGLSAYEMITFQYSIHTLKESGEVEHSSQFLSVSANEFPNLSFIKQLTSDLSKNVGSIFMWYPHESTSLKAIQKQILKLNLAKEYEVELAFIDTLLAGGDRELIDLFALSKNGIFYPNSKGSNSIKKVLPATINHSKFIQDKYSNAIYGSAKDIKSLNYESIEWVKKDNGGYRDPYDIIKDYSDDAITQGGMAATTFAKLQFEDLTDAQRTSLKTALLRYCELDTLAMVMIAESWLDRIKHVS